jgi:argininosuccinate lyase
MMAYTVADDREVDRRLIRWDIIGSLGHVAGLAKSRVITTAQHSRLRRALRHALVAADAGELRIGAEHEDVHSAVELWLTRHANGVGEVVHTGRSRNDQVATDLRLYLKDETLRLHGGMLDLAGVLVAFAAANRRAVWPGYTHQRAAMPSSAGLWASAFAAGLVDAADAIAGFWPRLDRSPLGSAAGYGVPLPLDRTAAARALGFGGIDEPVTLTQNGRGQLEAAILFWCIEAAHHCAKLAADVMLFSSSEFGWLTLPRTLATGSSIMPHKRNPDLFELTRARAAALEGDFAALLAVRGRLTSGYHRDFQFLKAPLFRGLDRTREMLGMLTTAVPQLGVDAERGLNAVQGESLATDAVMARVADGVPFRQAYREAAERLKHGEAIPRRSAAAIISARAGAGNMGNLPIAALRQGIARGRRWGKAQQRQLDRAITALVRGGGR